ncbi:MAG: M2 family metallopeptidase [Vicinamibacterales bacterium]
MTTRASLATSVTFAACTLAAGLLWTGVGARAQAPTPADAERFIADAERRLMELSVRASRAAWVQSNFITEDTQQLSAEANEALTAAITQLANEAKKYEGLTLAGDAARKLLLLKLALAAPAPSDPAKLSELTRIMASLEADYGKGKYCPAGKACLDISDIERSLRESRNPAVLREMWTGWHSVGAPMRDRYARFVELSNEGAREMGFTDLGAMWRSGYDMPPEAFAPELDRLWNQVRPLYESLHAYVRARLVTRYGPSVVASNGLIPAHLTGNLWAQQWGNIYDIVAPTGLPGGYDLTELLKQQKVDAKGMVRYGERFFSSLGFAPLPPTFWERSLFVRPRDRDVVCHASAWSIDYKDDLRIKMCIEPTAEDFVTIHHELGHNYYQRAYNRLSALYQGSANDGFHEAVGDTIALSVTPSYLQTIGLLKQVPPAQADIPLLLRDALDKVAFLPFGLLIDRWRWGVFSGEITKANYNAAWWDLKRKYQGVEPPAARSEVDFDPGAKYHVPANTPYSRYFIAHILQYQFHRALCREAGYKGPLNRCSIYDNKKAGERLQKMLEMGTSRPWPDALEALTGERQMDATAILDYFAPLKAWLDEQNKGVAVGWATN